MEKIQDISITRFRVEESFGFLKIVQKEMESLPKEGQDPKAEGASPALTAAIAKMEAKYTAFDDALKDDDGLEATSIVTKTDDGRDRSWRGANAYVKAMCSHPVPATAKQAEVFRRDFLKYGDVTTLPQVQESGALHNLLQDLKKHDSSARAAIGLDAWIEDLEEKEEAFLNALGTRTDEEVSRKPRIGIIKQTREEAENAYRELVEVVNALMTINGAEPYATFANRVNALIDRQKKVLKTRKDSGAAEPSKKPSGDRPVIPEDPEEPETPDVPDGEEEGEGTGEGEGGESDRPVIPDEGKEEPEKDENGDDLPEIE